MPSVSRTNTNGALVDQLQAKTLVGEYVKHIEDLGVGFINDKVYMEDGNSDIKQTIDDIMEDITRKLESLVSI